MPCWRCRPRNFSWHVGYIGRDHRVWDYLPSYYDRYNYELSNIIELGFEHQVCDRFAWAPFIRYDCRKDELDEVGAWFDIMTDCLGFRVLAEYEDAYERIDGSKRRADTTIGFYIYLRSIGPNATLDLMKF